MAPMMFLYFRAMIQDDRGPRKWDWLHAIPFLLVVVNYLPFYLLSAEEKKAKLEAVVNNYAEYVQGQDGWLPENVMITLRIASLLVYIPFYFDLIVKHHRRINRANPFDRRMHRWLWILASSVSIYFLSVTVFLVTQLLPISVVSNPSYTLFLIGLNRFVEIFWTSSFVFMSVYQVLVPSVGIGQMSNLERRDEDSQLGHSSRMDEAKLDNINLHPDYAKIKKLFDQEKIWQDPNVTIQMIAQTVGFSTRKVSYMINKYMDGNYNQVINRYRIDQAKSLIAEGYLSKHSVEGLWQECGFANHTTFYQAFKKQTGKTPGEYEKQVLGLV
jgi:AraC-like DNA-binding protein